VCPRRAVMPPSLARSSQAAGPARESPHTSECAALEPSRPPHTTIGRAWDRGSPWRFARTRSATRRSEESGLHVGVPDSDSSQTSPEIEEFAACHRTDQSIAVGSSMSEKRTRAAGGVPATGSRRHTRGPRVGVRTRRRAGSVAAEENESTVNGVVNDPPTFLPRRRCERAPRASAGPTMRAPRMRRGTPRRKGRDGDRGGMAEVYTQGRGAGSRKTRPAGYFRQQG
jgi:hypothetical protein